MVDSGYPYINIDDGFFGGRDAEGNLLVHQNNSMCFRVNKTFYMKKIITDRNLTIINITIVLYFLVVYLIHIYKVDYVIVGVFREILTIPFLIAQFVFVVIGINYMMKHKKRILTTMSLVALIVCTILTIGSFFK